MYSDLLQAIDQGKVCVVIILYLSAVFVDIPTLLSILSHDYKIVGTALDGFESYMTG